MEVNILTHTPEPDKLATLAALTCYSRDVPDMEDISEEKIAEVLGMVKESGHYSVIEHASFTFAAKNVSRSLTHQLVRHRIASYSQQSQRYVDMKDFAWVKPESITHEETEEVYRDFMDVVEETYSKLKEKIPVEDARYVLPNATASNIIITMNARELWHFFSLRCCRRAQWEIRELADRMLELVTKVAPVIFEDAGAPCLRGPCPESPELSCGKPFKKDGGQELL
ncbi:MAG: FAD-dependent thymidylate synthase [Thermoplasmata archaeon]